MNTRWAKRGTFNHDTPQQSALPTHCTQHTLAAEVRTQPHPGVWDCVRYTRLWKCYVRGVLPQALRQEAPILDFVVSFFGCVFFFGAKVTIRKAAC